MNLNLLFIGDIVGKGGRKAVQSVGAELKAAEKCSFCIANAENIAGGSGITAKCLEAISPSVVDVVTAGDHIWDQKGFDSEITGLPNVLRAANLCSLQPGRGFGVYRNPVCGEIAVISLLGRIFMKSDANCPFETAEQILAKLPKTVKTIIVDFHAEATSEKAAMARFLDGKVTAVIGTHTHVQTADARILSKGTAFISDVGMVGAEDSILGRDIEAVVRRFRTGMPQKFEVVETGIRLDAVVVSYDSETGKATQIKNLSVKTNI